VDKKTRGLPPSFQLDVARAAVDPPVQLGDYLDEEEASPAVKRVAPLAPAATFTEPPRRGHTDPSTPPASAAVHQARLRPRFPVPKPTRLATTVPRKQVNMTPETLRMVDDVLDYVRTYSVQKDTKASELFHALVLALYEARDYLDLSRVQPRGRWGTPTAAAFPIAIKNAIQAAIADWHYGNKG
jgi:hypothetical protein